MDKKVFTVGDGQHNEFVLTHNLGTPDVVVAVRKNTLPGVLVMAEVLIVNQDVVKITIFGEVGQDAYSVTVIG